MTDAYNLLVLASANEPGELRLLRAVLVDGLCCALGTGLRAGTSFGTRTHTERIVREARYWVASRRRRSLFDFEVVTEWLGLDASAVRRQVMRGMEG